MMSFFTSLWGAEREGMSKDESTTRSSIPVLVWPFLSADSAGTLSSGIEVASAAAKFLRFDGNKLKGFNHQK